MLAVGLFPFLHRTLPLRALARLGIVAALVAAGLTVPSLAQSPPEPGTTVVDPASGLHPGWTLLLGVLLMASLFVLWRFIFRAVSRIVRAVGRLTGRRLGPLTRRLARVLRLLRLLPREPKPLVAPSVAGVTMGTIGRTLVTGSETEDAIAKDIDRRELDAMLQRHGRFPCTWLSARQTQMPKYDAKAAEADRQKVESFFRASVPLYFNPFNLYEDADGAFIVGLFRTSDRRIFHVLSEFRKTINRNVLWLSILFPVVVSLVALANVFLSTWIPFHSSLGIGHLNYPHPLVGLSSFAVEWRPVPTDTFDRFVFGVLSCFAGLAIMWLFDKTRYAPFQRNNGQQMANFLQRYLDRIRNDVSEIARNAVETVAGEREAQEMKRDSVLWMTTLQWMAFRAFFIECYLRNVLFQIHRNSTYYVVFIPLSFIAFFLGAAVWYAGASFNVSSLLYQQNSFYLGLLILVFVCYRYLRDPLSSVWQSIFPSEDGEEDRPAEDIAGEDTPVEKMPGEDRPVEHMPGEDTSGEDTAEEETPGERVGGWTKFRDLEVHRSIARTLEVYVDSLERWRSMMKSRG